MHRGRRVKEGDGPRFRIGCWRALVFRSLDGLQDQDRLERLLGAWRRVSTLRLGVRSLLCGFGSVKGRWSASHCTRRASPAAAPSPAPRPLVTLLRALENAISFTTLPHFILDYVRLLEVFFFFTDLQSAALSLFYTIFTNALYLHGLFGGLSRSSRATPS